VRKLLIVLAACGSTPDAPDAGPPDASRGLDATGIPQSCAQILQFDPNAPSGVYTIDPDGNGSDPQFSVQCDMTTAGGGWTVVFLAPNSNLMATPIAYTSATPRLLGDATDAMIAFRDASGSALPNEAVFPMPNDWRFDTPFDSSATDLTTNVSVAGAAPVPATLRYGNESFQSACSDPWVAVGWGRLCIVGTAAPYYTGFNTASADDCTDSTQLLSAAACDDSHRFSIAIR